MTSLAPCSHCARHVRVGEGPCPFCGASTASLTAPPLRRAPRRFARAALVAGALLGTACGTSSSSEPAQTTTTDEPAQEEHEEPAPEEDPGSQVEMYGAPSSDLWV
jgi:hypothetical protein